MSKQAKIKIGILGLGAIGSVLANALQTQDHLDLNAYIRRASHPITVKTPNGEHRLSVPLHQTTALGKELDWLLVCLKAYHYPAAKPMLQALIGTNTKVVVFRNGLNLDQALLPFCDTDRILVTMIDCPTQKLSEGYYHQLRLAKVGLPDTSLAVEFAALLQGSDIEVQISQDFKTASWLKLCESAAIGALTCLSGAPAVVLQDQEIWNFYVQLVKESIRVAKADGALVDEHSVETILAKASAYPSNKGSSMLNDRLAGNPIELEAKNGIISKLGKEYGIDTPLHDLVCTLLKHTNR